MVLAYNIGQHVEPRLSRLSFMLVLVTHAAALFALTTNIAPSKQPEKDAIIQVQFIAPVLKTPPAPPPALHPTSKRPAKPQKVAPQKTEQVLATQTAEAVPLTSQPVQPPVPVVTAAKPEEIAPAAKAVVASSTPEPVIEPPRFNADYLDNPSPAYPRLSRRSGEEGRVLLRVQVDNNGLPTQITLHQSSGFSRLDESAMETVRQWKFVPARKGGQTVEAWVIVPIQFSLKG